ncbi:MAG: glutamate-1-semialdehyde 2,1-aminomutase [Pseudomonadota bacterium]|nr:glutamate-1-semialdehyde 2,1-aminomutase [Pseudomonadota bacterium]
MAKSLEKTSALFKRALAASPGGVHSPVRAFKHVGGNPFFVKSAQGNSIVDTNNETYLDFCMAFGPLILGHNHSEINAELHDALDKGWSYGTAETYSLELAELIKERIKWIDQIRFVNSGTEAVMSALRLARAVTGRDQILKFSGCYHGHVDSMLVAAGSGMATEAQSSGVRKDTVQNTLVAPLDDEKKASEIFTNYSKNLACVIIEIIPANYGLLPQRREFLKHIKYLCEKNDVLLIFDEVVTGFRLGFGGCTELFDIQPDIVTWGKIIGGGFPVGAFAAKKELMQRIAPLGNVYQAGTLSANPIAMRAGLATLKILSSGEIYTHLEALGTELEDRLKSNQRYSLQRAGSIFWIHPKLEKDQPLRTANAVDQLHEYFPEMFSALRKAKIYIPPSPYEVGFLSAAHKKEDVIALAEVLNKI